MTRLRQFLQRSIQGGLGWVALESQSDALWTRIADEVSRFLRQLWESGVLHGDKCEEAFYVRCDRTTMTQDDIDNGRVILVYGGAMSGTASLVRVLAGASDPASGGGLMSDSVSSSLRTEPGRIPRRTKAADQTGWDRWLPGLRTLREYQVAWLRHDVVAGLVLTTMLVPVGIAYAEAAGVPGIYGLYATIVPLLAYALFGPSRILVLGPDSSLAAVILAVVLPLSGGDPRRAVAIASMMAVVSGTVCILAGMARLGFVTELLSKPIRYGYMNGIALTVLIGQLPKLFGFSIESDGPLQQRVGDRDRARGWQDQLDHVRGWRRHPRGDSAAQGPQAITGNPDRRRRSDRRRRRAEPRGARRRVGARLPPTGSARRSPSRGSPPPISSPS